MTAERSFPALFANSELAPATILFDQSVSQQSRNQAAEVGQEGEQFTRRCRLDGHDSMPFRLNHQVLYEETDLLLRYGRCSFELLHGHRCGRIYVPVQLAMSLHLGGDARDKTLICRKASETAHLW
jgi:hypothetical protein